jgi:hypothetical protein
VKAIGFLVGAFSVFLGGVGDRQRAVQAQHDCVPATDSVGVGRAGYSVDGPEAWPSKDLRHGLGQAGAVGEHPQRGHSDHADHAVAVGADAKTVGPSGKLMHVGSASELGKLVDIAITIFSYVAGTFTHVDLTKRSQHHRLVNV